MQEIICQHLLIYKLLGLHPLVCFRVPLLVKDSYLLHEINFLVHHFEIALVWHVNLVLVSQLLMDSLLVPFSAGDLRKELFDSVAVRLTLV